MLDQIICICIQGYTNYAVVSGKNDEKQPVNTAAMTVHTYLHGLKSVVYELLAHA